MVADPLQPFIKSICDKCVVRFLKERRQAVLSAHSLRSVACLSIFFNWSSISILTLFIEADRTSFLPPSYQYCPVFGFSFSSSFTLQSLKCEHSVHSSLKVAAFCLFWQCFRSSTEGALHGDYVLSAYFFKEYASPFGLTWWGRIWEPSKLI